MGKSIVNSLLLVLLSFTLTAMADAPPSLDLPDAHSNVYKGVLSLYRVQVKDLKFGKGNDILDTELFVTLDSTKDKAYTISIRDDSPAINKVIADTLREAYLHNTPITIYSSKFPKSNAAEEILLVQMDRRKTSPLQSGSADIKSPTANANE
jgi:hypothetical protein